LAWTLLKRQIQDVNNATAMEFRLIENIEREDLTDAEKGNAVARSLASFPKLYPTIKSLAKQHIV